MTWRGSAALARTTPALLALALLLGVAAGAQAQLTVPTETTNAALRYWMAFALMQDPPADRATGDRLERVAAGDAVWDETRLGPILDANQEAIATLRRASVLPSADWGVEYGLGPYAAVPHLAKGRVLARLNTLAGKRALARGDVAEALDTWLAGLRFTRHLASDSSLIGVLSARAAFIAHARALREAASRLSDQQRARVVGALEAWPEEVFDWGQAINLEAGALLSGARMLATSPERLPGFRESRQGGRETDVTPPTPEQITQFTRFVGQIVEAVGESPDETERRLPQLRRAQASLHPFLQLLPALDRVNSSRTELRQERQRLLDAMER
jgi:hypothetical protein